jgi:hypothetical protein
MATLLDRMKKLISRMKPATEWSQAKIWRRQSQLRRGRVGWLAVIMAGFTVAWAQADLPVYTDRLVNGWQDWSWATVVKTNATPVHSGTSSIKVTAGAYQALAIHNNENLNAALYTNLVFWIHGGTTGGQALQVTALANGQALTPVPISAPVANAWQMRTVSLAALGVAGRTNLNGFWIQNRTGGSLAPFYLDDVQLLAAPAPATVHLTAKAAPTLRAVDGRWAGLNTAVWDGELDTPATLSLLQEMGALALRFPGGSLADEYHWQSDTSGTNTWQWATSFDHFAHLATNLGAQVFLTANYGTGTPAEAAAWVRYANVTRGSGIRYWEIGNEVYGTWETDTTPRPHDPFTYAQRVMDYAAQMKAADPTIKIGVVVTPGETNYDNGYHDHPAVNPRTGQTVYGWTPVLLATLRSLGVTPDFVVHHRYPQWSGVESDPLLLQDSVGWAADAADLRQQLKDYLGAGASGVELVCTENNSVSSGPGKQTTSLVNALYLADSFGQLMQTEFNALVWWDLRNGADSGNNNDASLYGWRLYGDYGITAGTARYPVFYGAKLLQHFARPGDGVVAASTDYPLLAAYATRHADGALALLVINKDPGLTMNTAITLASFQPATPATVWSFGIPQDDAGQTGGGTTDLTKTALNGVAAGFNCQFPPYSLTVLVLPPAAPTLTISSVPWAPAEQVVLQLAGQPGARYVTEVSTDLKQWSPVATNTLTGGTATLTNAVPAGVSATCWRTVWLPLE